MAARGAVGRDEEGAAEVTLGSLRRARQASQKIQKSSRSVLTVRRAAAYIRLTNEGGAPLATKKFALVERNPESRVSDTLQGQGAKSEPVHDIVSAVSVL